MNAVLREYLLKGIFLGLWAYLAVLGPGWDEFGRAVAWAGGGLALGLLAGAATHVRRGLRPLGNPAGFGLLTLLDSPFFVYLGLVGGLVAGVLVETTPAPGRDWLGYFVGGGAALGYGFAQLGRVRDRRWRFGFGVVVGAALVYLAVFYLGELPAFADPAARQQFAAQLLVGLPFFYLLTFCGEAEESEVEIAALCAALGVGLYLLRLSSGLPDQADKLIFFVPLALYYVYATRVLPGLRVFKHTLRGYGYLSAGRTRDAVAGFGRALTLDPRNGLAAQGLWELHRRLDVSSLDDATARLLNFPFILGMAERTLAGAQPPSPGKRDEALRLLDLVGRHRPDLQPRADYLRAVALTHARRFDDAADVLRHLLDPQTPYPGSGRDGVLYPAWVLALRLHPEVVKRLGPTELDKPGRRVEALGAVERTLREVPDDPTAVELRRALYAGLTEGEFSAAAADGPPADLNYEHVEQLGLALVGDPDPARVDRGMAYLRIAGRGLPAHGPGLFTALADLATKLGRADEAAGYLEQVKRAALAAGGPAHLPPDQRALYTAALKRLADAATDRGDFEAAVGDVRLSLEAGGEDVPTLRRLADLHEKAGDVLNALLITERGLLYSAKDPDLRERKARYYYSVPVERVVAVRDKVRKWFDADYCVKTARQVLDGKEADAAALDWALHLIRLARVVRPDSQAALLAEAQLRLRLGEWDDALRLLEDLREQKRGSGEDEDAWYAGTRLLAGLYLDELDRPDLAVGCYKDYREYSKSGADTLYQLGRAYEASGDAAGAKRSYKAVTGYSNHPRYYDALEAVRRLEEG